MKNVLIIFVLLMTSCVTTKNANTKTLKLVKSSAQHYTLGINANNGKTSGETFSMHFENKTEIVVKRVWIEGVNIDFEQVKTAENGSFRLRATKYKKNNENIHTDIKAPIKYEGEALIEYNENEEVKFFIIKKFTKYAKSGLNN